jgi:hypothetical protein
VGRGRVRVALQGVVWFLAAAIPVAAVHLLAAGEFGRRVATVGEATTAAFAAALGRFDAARPPVPLPDIVAVHQLAVLDVLVGPLRGGSVMDGNRAAMLFAAFVSSLALWPVLVQRLRLRHSAAVAGVLAAGVPTAVSGLHGMVDAGVPAALWLTVAAALPSRGRAARVLVAAALLLAVATAALAAVPLLVLLAHLVVTGTRWSRTARIVAGLGLAALAAGVAVLATGTRPLAATGDGSLSQSVLQGTVVVGVCLCLVAWVRLRWARPVVTGVLALGLCALVPGPSATTAVVLVLPGFAVLFALLVDEAATDAATTDATAPTWRPRLVTAAALLLVALTVAPVVPAAARAVGTERVPGDLLAQWIDGHLEPGALLAVDDLGREQLIRDGVAPDRLVPLDRPADGTLVVVSARPSRGPQPEMDSSRSVRLATVDDGPGDAVTTVWRPVTDLEATRTAAALDRDDRARVGAMLATNPSLTLSPRARRLLVGGSVDARLITVLAGFASSHQLEVSEFVAVTAEPADAPLRTAVIVMVDGWSLDRANAAELTQRWLAAQLPPYRPLLVQRTDRALLVRFATPAPLGLLGH